MKTRYTEEHEWVTKNDDIFTIGITDYAQDQLGDIVYVQLPQTDSEINKGDDLSVIESVKAAGEVKSPISGVVLEVNEELDGEPELVNESAEDSGWLCKIKCINDSEFNALMDAHQYQAFLRKLS
ncbi:MAG: glycine cleavage system protein GcvH [Gammaproteobacteria bacterium]|nr:glycine cleavage system protein GcvH [Gammaproteobacteria bacterium]MCY4219229.1 glycine cleavage system protein GcvH [Gammaproteobacteria bacterium]MCY4274239.1 glycine cleavage system protein GcvH [Gammaproteobacteria bacterium]